MKKNLLFLFCTLLAQIAFAQDIILKVNGDELKVKVLEITPVHVIYQSPDSIAGKQYSLAKTDIFIIRFANGTKEVFQESLIAQEVVGSVANNSDEMYRMGQEDAKLLYNGNDAMWGSAASTIALGLIGPIIIGAIRPHADANKTLPVASLQDIHYVRGYERQAHKRKVGKVAIGAGIGTVTFFAILIASLNAAR